MTVLSKCGAAFPCQHPGCGLGRNNDIHRKQRIIGFHEYVPMVGHPVELTLEERVELLERKVGLLEERSYR